MRDLKNSLKVSTGILPAVKTSDTNGTSVDMKGYDSLMILATVGAPGDTLSGSVKIEFEVEHSDDNSSFSDCADADITDATTGTNTGTFAVVDAAGDASQSYKCNYIGAKRYVRCVANFTGTHTNGSPVDVKMIQGHALAQPVS